MKRVLFFALAFTIITACNEAEKKQIESLQTENQKLQAEALAKDSAVNEFFRILNEIEANLAIVKEREQVIAKNTALGHELQPDTRDRINDDINLINELMSKNKQSIRYLNNQLKGANFKIDEFENRLQQASTLLETRDQEINVMKDRLTELDFSIEMLNAALDTLSREKEQLLVEVQKQTQELTTAWYAYGTKRELIENHITERVGGFLGIGKNLKLKADFDTSYFTRIDITTTTSIPLYAKKPKLITTHPTNSYRIIENSSGIVEKLEIVDPKEFWFSTKHLVIEVN